MELTEEVKALLLNTAQELKGSARRMFMARTVQALGEGGQRLAERELNWNCGTIRKGMHEVESGRMCLDGFRLRGRKRSEDHLPNLLKDITAIVDGQSQADPQFCTNSHAPWGTTIHENALDSSQEPANSRRSTTI